MQKAILATTGIAAGVIGLGQLAVTADDVSAQRGEMLSNGSSNEPGGPIQGGTPDVIVWEISGTAQWTDATYHAYSVGTTSCNVGTANLSWTSGTNQHPVIGQNLLRVHDGRIEHLGQGWLKHGFCALDLNACGNCQGTGCGSLGVGCSDPYTASRNGSQGPAGPKYQVNATTGFFNYPPADPSYSGNTARRLRTEHANVTAANYPGARYFIEAQYIHPQDSPQDAGDSSNNGSYREVSLGSTGNFNGYTGSTVREKPGIEAWKAVYPDVVINKISLANEGNYYIGTRVVDNGNGTWTYDYAIENQDSDRSVPPHFHIPVPDSVTLTNVEFNDVDYHSGEPWDGTDWTFSHTGGVVTWTTESHASNPDANAIRWATLYSFRFTADSAPEFVSTDLDYFKPGSGTSFSTTVQAPGDATQFIAISFPNGLPDIVNPAGETIAVRIEELIEGGLVPGTETFYYREGIIGQFIQSPLVSTGGDLYEATLPATTCTSPVQFYFSAEDSGGTVRTSPNGAPSFVYHAVSLISETIEFEDDMETDMGWTVLDVDITDGTWERAIPVGNGGDRDDPPTDADGSGQCWLTDNAFNGDVDGGPTILTSPNLALAGLEEAFIGYKYWMHSNPPGDVMNVQISDDGGSTWTTVINHGHKVGWTDMSIPVSNYVSLTDQVRLKFSVADNPNDAITEAGVDALSVTSVVCGDGEPCPADVDGNGEVAFNDLVALLASWGPCPGCPADVDGNGEVAFNDLVTLLAAWGPCP